MSTTNDSRTLTTKNNNNCMRNIWKKIILWNNPNKNEKQEKNKNKEWMFSNDIIISISLHASIRFIWGKKIIIGRIRIQRRRSMIFNEELIVKKCMCTFSQCFMIHRSSYHVQPKNINNSNGHQIYVRCSMMDRSLSTDHKNEFKFYWKYIGRKV